MRNDRTSSNSERPILINRVASTSSRIISRVLLALDQASERERPHGPHMLVQLISSWPAITLIRPTQDGLTSFYCRFIAADCKRQLNLFGGSYGIQEDDDGKGD